MLDRFSGSLLADEFSFYRRSYVNQQFWYSHDDTNAGIAGAGNNVNDYSVSGYVPVKYIHPDDSWANGKGSVKGAFVTSLNRSLSFVMVKCYWNM